MSKTEREYYEFDCALCRILHLPIPDPITEVLFNAVKAGTIAFAKMAEMFTILGIQAAQASIATGELREALSRLLNRPALDYNCRPLVACGISRWVYGAFPGPISKGEE